MKDTTYFERIYQIHNNDDIGLQYCGKRIDTINHQYDNILHDRWLFVLINKGDALLTSPIKYDLHEHDLLIMFPDTRVTYSATTAWSIQWVELYGKTVSDYVSGLGISKKSPVIHLTHYSEIEHVLNQIYNVSREDTFSTKLSLTSFVYEFFSLLSVNMQLCSDLNYIDASKRIIEQNINNQLSISQIACTLGINPSYFSRIFTHSEGISPKQYIINQKILLAKELLVSSSLSVKEVSTRVGYNDPLYFSRIFKKNTGCSPKQYVHDCK